MRILFLLPACQPTIQGGSDDSASGDSGEPGCMEYAASSVTVHVFAPDGTTIRNAAVTWTADGADQGTCESGAEGDWVCGWEVAGHIAVTVAAPGYEAQTQEVDVAMSADGCHVVGQELMFTLDPEATGCTEEARPSVLATLRGSGGEELREPSVTWGLANSDMAPQACTAGGEVWVCGEEVAGTLEIYGTAGGHTTDMETVEVPMTSDGCHVVTQQVALEVEWQPD